MIKTFVFVFGSIVGSFLNVCIYRMPKKESIVSPRSHCISCGRTIPWYDNIPLLSILILRSKCRWCKTPISFLYFIVEILTAGSFVLLYVFYGLTVEFVIYAALVSALIVVSFIDLKIQEIPDEISLPGIAIGVILCSIFPGLISQGSHVAGLIHSIIGLLTGGGLIYLMGLLGESIFKKEAMGGGDVKLMAMLGAFLGWKLIILTFFLAPFFGSAVGIVAKIKHKEDIIPYGPHLSLASVVALLWGNKILSYIFVY